MLREDAWIMKIRSRVCKIATSTRNSYVSLRMLNNHNRSLTYAFIIDSFLC